MAGSKSRLVRVIVIFEEIYVDHSWNFILGGDTAVISAVGCHSTDAISGCQNSRRKAALQCTVTYRTFVK